MRNVRFGFTRSAAAGAGFLPASSGARLRKRFRLRQRRLRAGFTVFGVMLGLVLVAAAIVGVVSVYNSATESSKRTAAARLLNQLKANIELTHAGSPSYGTAATDLVRTLARRGLIPDDALVVNGAGVDDDAIRNPFGGVVAITGNPTATALPTTFEIQYGGVETETCNDLGDAYVGRSRSRSGLVLMGVSATDLSDHTSPVSLSSTQAAPFTRAQLETLCAAVTTIGTVAFRFR